MPLPSKVVWWAFYLSVAVALFLITLGMIRRLIGPSACAWLAW